MTVDRHVTGRSEERGDTYIEVLIAVVIIAFAAVAILGALTTSITASAEHRGLSVDETLVKSYTEATKYQVEFQPSPLFTPCASVSTYDTPVHAAFSNPNIGGGSSYDVHVTSVQYWSGSAFVATCTNAAGQPNQKNGVQMITVTATNSQSHVTRDLTTIVRDPQKRACYVSGSTAAC